MADMAHLEKMGRELKCPICLGLLNSAVSLTCNHVFCSSCISKSMKAASTCPVCKVPYSRREVRPAPHMDNLVSIYKSMEAATGLNIFVTQTAPLTKFSEDLPAHGEVEKSCLQETKGKGKSKRNGVSDKKPKESKKSDVCISNSHQSKPSFPAKKRVHVTPYPVSETPLRPEKLSKLGEPGIQCEFNGELDVIVRDGNKENSSVLKEKLALNEKGDPTCSPFFWLREADDNDDISEKPSTQQTPDMPLINSPCFSDIKDSENESPTRMTPTSEHQVAQVFDSEMFEWTQRACSPELCSTPIKKQTANKCTLDNSREKGCEAALESVSADSYEVPGSEKVKSPSHGKENEKFADNITDGSAQKRRLKRKNMCNKKINKKCAKTYAKRKKETLLDKAFPEHCFESTESAASLGLCNPECKDNETPPERKNNNMEQKPTSHLPRKHLRKLKNLFDDNSAKALEKLPNESSEVKNQSHGSNDEGVQFLAFSFQNSGKDRTLDGQSEDDKRVKKNRVQSLRKCARASKDDPMSRTLKDVPPGPCTEAQHLNQDNQKMEMSFSELSLQQIRNKMFLDSGNGSSKRVEKVSAKQQKQIRILKGTDIMDIDKKVRGQQHRKCTRKSMDDAIAKILEDVPSDPCSKAQNENKKCQKMGKSLDSSYQLVRNGKIVGPGNGSCKRDESISIPQQKRRKRQKAQNRWTGQANVATDKDGSSDEALDSRCGGNTTDEKVCTQLQVMQVEAENSPARVPPLAIEVTTAKAGEKLEDANYLITKLQQKHMSSGVKNAAKTQEIVANHNILQKCGNLQSEVQCAFCQSSKDSEVSGEMMHYLKGNPVAADFIGWVNVIHSHKHCTEWAPNVYFEDETAINLEVELTRSKRIKCSCCGIKGAALGCYEKTCRKSFHFICAKLIPQCRWDTENFVMLCPVHSSSSLPNEVSQPQKKKSKRATLKGKMQVQRTTKPASSISQLWKWPSGSPCRWLLCCSSLNFAEKEIVSEFTKLSCVPVSKTWSPLITHVIASADENRACRRTLKFLMGIMEGKWILSIDWIKACIKAMEPVDEEQYEITADIHGINDGPRLGRLRATNKQPKLFDGFMFYFSGDFAASYKGYLQDLVIAAGGTVLNRKPISRNKERLLDDPSESPTFIIYSLELHEKLSGPDAVILDQRRAEAETLAGASEAKLATNTWILNSMAGCKLQEFGNC